MNTQTFSTALSILIVAQLGIMSPGPDTLLMIRNSIRYPLFQAIGTSLGISFGVVFHLTLCTIGLAALIASSPSLLHFLTYIGAAYLMMIGYKLVCKGGSNKETGEIVQKHVVSWSRAFREGLLCNLTNPKVSLFFLGVFTQLIPAEDSIAHRLGYASLLGIHSMLYWVILAILIQKLRLDVVLLRWGGLFDKIFGAVLVGISLRLILAVAH